MIKLGSWTNPSTGQQRIYINKFPPLRASDKLYLVPVTPSTINPEGYRAKIQSAYLADYRDYGSDPITIAEALAGQAIDDLGLSGYTFDELLEQCS